MLQVWYHHCLTAYRHYTLSSRWWIPSKHRTNRPRNWPYSHSLKGIQCAKNETCGRQENRDRQSLYATISIRYLYQHRKLKDHFRVSMYAFLWQKPLNCTCGAKVHDDCLLHTLSNHNCWHQNWEDNQRKF